MNKIKETVEFIYNDIKVYVKIDYINNKISLVEPLSWRIVQDDNNLTASWKELSWKFKKKEWLFAERWVEYMNWWLNILDAMKYAIEKAKKMYEAELEKTSRFNWCVVEEYFALYDKTKHIPKWNNRKNNWLK